MEQHPALRKTKRTFKMGSSVSRSCWRAGEHGFCMSVRQYYLDRRRVRPGAAPIALCVLPSCCAHRLEPPAAERADRALSARWFAQVPSTRRALRCQVSCSRRICAASHLTCSRILTPRLPPALGRSPLIGAKVITRSTSSSASAASPSPPRQLPTRHAAPWSGPRGGPLVAGRASLVGERACVAAHIGMRAQWRRAVAEQRRAVAEQRRPLVV